MDEILIFEVSGYDSCILLDHEKIIENNFNLYNDVLFDQKFDYNIEGIKQIESLIPFIKKDIGDEIQSRDVVANNKIYRFSEVRFFHWTSSEEMDEFLGKNPNYEYNIAEDGYYVYEKFLTEFKSGKDALSIIFERTIK